MAADLTQGSLIKSMIAFAIPVFVGLLLQQLYHTVDTIIVGNYAGETALAAVGTTGSLFMAFLALANGFSAGAGVIAAQHFGAKRMDDMRKSASSAIVLMLGMGAVSTIVSLLLCRPFFELISVPPEFLDLSVLFFRICAAGMVFQFGYNIVAALLRAIGDSRAGTLFLLISSVINIALNLLFVAHFKMGVAGSSLATLIAQVVSCIASFAYMFRKYPFFRWKLSEFTYRWSLARQVLYVGFPMALQQLIVSFGFSFIQNAVNGYGSAMTASFAVGQRIENYLFMPPAAMQVTMATFTGQNMGAKRPERVQQGAKLGGLISVFGTLFFSIIVYAFAESIAAAFGLGSDAQVFCIQHLQVTAFTSLILACYFPLFGVFQGVGSGLIPTFVATLALSLRVLSTYTLCHWSFMDYRIIWWNTAFGFTPALMLTLFIFKLGRWKTHELTQVR